MRLAIAGTHCSGKTTLIDEYLTRHPDYSHEPEAYEALLEIYGDFFAAELSAEDFIQQLEYQGDRLRQYRRGDCVIFDRSPLDYVAYLQALVELNRQTADAALAQHAINVARDAIRLLDSIVFLPGRETSIYVPEEEDPELRLAVDIRLESILMNDELDILGADGPAVVEAAGSPSQRLKILERTLESG